MKALVTGGSAGLGRAFCRLLSENGCEIHVVDLEPPDPSSRAIFHACDLSREADLSTLSARLVGRGPFDLVIHSAGISDVGPFETRDRETAQRILAVNLRAPILLTRDLSARGGLARGGRLIFVASLSHRVGYPGASVYAASKDGIVVFARSIRRAFWRKQGVRVQVLLPGPMRTEHATRYAPPGSTGKGRIDPAFVARLALRTNRAMIVPGWPATVMACFGRLFPLTATRLMHRLIYSRFADAAHDLDRKT